jgi:hypothetical protein
MWLQLTVFAVCELLFHRRCAAYVRIQCRTWRRTRRRSQLLSLQSLRCER